MSIIIDGKHYCLSCRKEQLHRLVYVGHPETSGEIFLKKMVCCECGNVLSMDRIEILESYFKKISGRILNEPFRVMKEFEKHPYGFLMDWPRKSLNKSCRLAREIFEIVRN